MSDDPFNDLLDRLAKITANEVAMRKFIFQLAKDKPEFFVDDSPPGLEDLEQEDVDNIMANVRAGRGIAAIKHYRNVTGMDLRESKKIIDAVIAEYKQTTQQLGEDDNE